MSWYFTLLLCGLFLIGAEIFVPGGILGIAGAAALIGAAVIGFTSFPPLFGWLSLLLILTLSGGAVYVWMKYLPQSPVGRALSLAQKLGTGESDTPANKPRWEPGMSGTALSTLRPAGKARIEGRLADVIAADGTWIEKNTAVTVVRAEGNRIYVRETNA